MKTKYRLRTILILLIIILVNKRAYSGSTYGILVKDTIKGTQYTKIENQGKDTWFIGNRVYSEREIYEAYLNKNGWLGISWDNWVGILITSILGTFLFRKIGKEFLKYYEKYWKEYYAYEKIEASARAKLHNIRNNYTILIDFLDNKQFDLAQQYVENSAYFYSKVLNNWGSTNWKLADELNLLQRFYEAERIITQDINLQISTGDLDEKSVYFLPEVFTTLLHNSMHHAFKDKKEACIVSIEVSKHENLLSITVKDNGNWSQLDKYMNREDSGLSILKHRIENEFKLKEVKTKLKDKFEIKTGYDGWSTIIKFYLPYAVSA